MLASAFAEMFSLGAVLPFIGVLTAPEKVFRYTMVREFAASWGISSGEALMQPFTVIFVGLAVVACFTRLLLLWVNSHLTFAIGGDLSVEAFRRTLYQPYSVHAATNSSTVISTITHKTNAVIWGVIGPALSLVSSALILIAIVGMLIAIDAAVAMTAGLTLGGLYAGITYFYHDQLQKNGDLITRSYENSQKALQEGLGGIRDVLLDGTQPLYCEIFRRADRRMRRALGYNIFVSGAPRYIMEAVGMVLIAGLAYQLSRGPDGVARALPTLAALALGAQRLLPALQEVYRSWASIVGSSASLADALDILERPISPHDTQSHPEPLRFRGEIRFENLSFRYQEDGPWVLKNISVTIPKGARIGIVGETGSGKSTLLDLLMGLLEPSEGHILVDGRTIDGRNMRSWQRAIAHVPQSIYLADTSIAENIAFGVPPAEIDMTRVREAARQAQIANFIESRPEGFDCFVGERGIRLSGGQRQRLGIARALCKQAQVLVLDEATSALDNTTEKAVMDAIESVDRDITILMIAHRLSTIKHCDMIIELENGRIVGQGTYDELFASSVSFRKMAMDYRTTAHLAG